MNLRINGVLMGFGFQVKQYLAFLLQSCGICFMFRLGAKTMKFHHAIIQTVFKKKKESDLHSTNVLSCFSWIVSAIS